MNVNGVTGTDAYRGTYASQSSAGKAAEVTEAEPKSAATEAAVYEPGSAAATAGASKTYQKNPEMVAKLQADAEERTSQLRSLVEQLITKQGQTIGKANDIYSFLAGGNFTVDAATKAQAQADIAEDGYWGVEQTSDRILDFAKALSGGSPEKMQEMLGAFKKGFEQATATWGKELPDISQRTYDAVIKKFEDYQNSQTASEI